MTIRKFYADIDVEGKVITNSIKYNTSGFTGTLSVGERRWNNSVGTTELRLKGGNVTLQDGQEIVMYVYNRSGVDILNGKAVTIIGAEGDIDAVELAIASGDGNTKYMVAGIATETIPNNNYGFITTIGQIHDLNLIDYNEGEDVYLSQTSAGDLVHLSDLQITGRTILLGKVIKNASIDGVLRLAIQNEMITANNTMGEIDTFTVNDTSTGVFSFSGITSATTTTFNISPVEGWIVDNETNSLNPIVKHISYSGSTGQTTPFLTANTQTYVLLNSDAEVVYQSTFPTPTQRRQNIYLGTIIHSNYTTITVIGNPTDYVLSPLSQLRDMFTPIGLINGGVYPSVSGSNLSLTSNSGYVYGLGINFFRDKTDPNRVFMPLQSPISFRYRTQTGGTASFTSTITPSIYDVNGVATSFGGSSKLATNQRIYLGQEGVFIIQYGQNIYGTLDEAITAIPTESFNVYEPLKTNAMLLGVVSVLKTATDLSNISQAKLTLASKFGEINSGGGGGSGSISTTSLQNAYDNSAYPEILTNSVLDGFTIKRGSAADSDDLINFVNGSDVKVASITAEGKVNLKKAQFDVTMSGATAAKGEMNWDAVKGTFNFGMGYDSVIQQVGMELYYPPVINRSGSNFVEGAVVMINPALTVYNEKFNIIKGIGNGSYSNKLFLGILTMNIADQETGFVTKFGEVHDLQLSEIQPIDEVWVVGDILYVSPTIAGGLTKVEPQAPNIKLACATIQRIVGNSIDLFVRFENGYTLDELHNVYAVNKINGSPIVWNLLSNKWESLSGSTLSNTGVTTGIFTSTVGNGIAPFIVASSTVVNNLNANYLQGNTASAFATSGHTHNYLPLSGGTLSGNLIGTSFSVVSGTSSQFLKADGSLDPTLYFAKAGIEEAKALSGFVNGDGINVSYDHTNRTITLTGDLSYEWRGEVKTLISPWTSSAHPNTNGKWFLYSVDGINFTWSTTNWDFYDLMVSSVSYNTDPTLTFAIRETHGLMDYQSHKEFHTQIGTYRESGGQVTAGTYLENSATDSATTIGFDSVVLKDEDCITTIPAWIEGTYTTMYVSGSTSIFNTASSFPFIGTTDAYIQVNNASTGTLSLGVNGRYYNVYQILIPAAADVDSQKYRMIMLQPQATYTSLALAQAEDVRILNLGSLASASEEYFLYTRITYSTSNTYHNTGKVVIPVGGISYNIGNRAGQVNVAGFTGNNHAILSNLEWLNSNHNGTVGTKTLAATFSTTGVATETEYTSSNVINSIVYRDGSGGFSGGTITGTFIGGLTGLASSATTVTGTIQNNILSAPNLNSVGTITGGTWNAGIITSQYGGTGVNNGGRTLTVSANSGTLYYSNPTTTLTIANTATVSGINSGDQTITLSGDVSTTAMTNGIYAATLPNIASAGTYNTVVVNTKGQVTSGATYDYSPSTHKHYQLYQPDGNNPFVYTDNSGQLHIDGNIIQSGSTYNTHAENVYTTKDLIILRDGAIAGLANGEYVGFTAKLYDGVNDGQLVFDNTGTARVGDIGNLQPITTRIETPSDGYFPYWEAANNRLNFKQLSAGDVSGVQVLLESGVNIKSINNMSLLGSGDISIIGGATIDDAIPTGTTNGMFWFDPSTGLLSVYANNAWTIAGSGLSSFSGATSTYGSAPSGVVKSGDIWYNTGNTSLNIYSGSAWVATAPISGSSYYIQNQNTSAQTANIWINGNVKANNLELTSTAGIRLALSGVNWDYNVDTNGNLLIGNGNGAYLTLDKTNMLTTFASTIQATTAKLTNLGLGYIPMNKLDASGLGNSNISTNGTDVSIFGTLNTLKNVVGHSEGICKFFNTYIQDDFATSILIGKQISDGGAANFGYVANTTTPSNSRIYISHYTHGESISILNSGNVGIGYSTGTEIANNTLAVNGSVYFNGTLSVQGQSNLVNVFANQFSFNGGNKGVGFNRDVLNGNIFDATKGAFQIQHLDKTLEFQTYNGSDTFSFGGKVLIKSSAYDYQENLDVDSAATEVVAQVLTSSCTAAFFDYVIKNGVNLRAGTVTAVYEGTNVEFTEYGTNDLGNTSPVTLSVDVSGGYLRLLATTTTDNWIVKAIIRTL